MLARLPLVSVPLLCVYASASVYGSGFAPSIGNTQEVHHYEDESVEDYSQDNMHYAALSDEDFNMRRRRSLSNGKVNIEGENVSGGERDA
jgi:hypothetical protein